MYFNATKEFDQSLRIDPEDTYALDNKGLALDRLGNHTQAITYLDQALRINPQDITALCNLKNTLSVLGKVSESEKYGEKANQLQVDCKTVLFKPKILPLSLVSILRPVI